MVVISCGSDHVGGACAPSADLQVVQEGEGLHPLATSRRQGVLDLPRVLSSNEVAAVQNKLNKNTIAHSATSIEMM